MGPLDVEQARLEAVACFVGLQTQSDPTLNQLTGLAARLMRTPMALVTIVDRERVWLKARHGMDREWVPHEPGLCASCILQDDPWIVEDAASDPRTQANSLVTGPLGVRSYLGVPLQTSGHCNVGALCVLDGAPRQPSTTDIVNM
jgi:GAF domain-containing protein